MELPTQSRVQEPDMDMNRRSFEPAAGHGWNRLLDAVKSLAPADGMLRRPKRSIDRERQEFPFSLD